MSAIDALDLGARLAQLLVTGRRVSTYEPATLNALVQHCLEHPVAEDTAASAPIPALADLLVDACWPQVRAFGVVGLLRHHEQDRPEVTTIPDTVRALRALAQQPLFALQESGARAG